MEGTMSTGHSIGRVCYNAMRLLRLVYSLSLFLKISSLNAEFQKKVHLAPLNFQGTIF